MPGFFGYMAYSGAVLIPLFVAGHVPLLPVKKTHAKFPLGATPFGNESSRTA